MHKTLWVNYLEKITEYAFFSTHSLGHQNIKQKDKKVTDFFEVLLSISNCIKDFFPSS